ncbi:STAS-like domain-containing protein [Sulfurimonas sp. HSL3-7]|uniref:STAS-like domain-containing protein n=1 Tax=Sulfonitrofixus jiaomeiensis TaxID=3131938 RepID=UPI0031F9373C
MDEMKINVFSIVGQKDCTLPEDGDKVYQTIKKALVENKKTIINFKNVEKLTTAFLNNAIGKLYGEFEEAKLKDSLSVENLSESGKVRLKRVVTNAKNYFSNPDKMKESIKEILGEDDGE